MSGGRGTLSTSLNLYIFEFVTCDNGFLNYEKYSWFFFVVSKVSCTTEDQKILEVQKQTYILYYLFSARMVTVLTHLTMLFIPLPSHVVPVTNKAFVISQPFSSKFPAGQIRVPYSCDPNSLQFRPVIRTVLMQIPCSLDPCFLLE